MQYLVDSDWVIDYLHAIEPVRTRLIGATALHHDLTLLTNNRRDFERVEGLTIESA